MATEAPQSARSMLPGELSRQLEWLSPLRAGARLAGCWFNTVTAVAHREEELTS